jgi:hypothetical protein
MEKTRCKTRDVAFQFRMGAAFPGEVNRAHPFNITAELIDSVSPPTLYGQAVVIDSTADAGIGGVRPFAAGDGAQLPWGFTVRPYPTQQATAASLGAPASFGNATPPTTGVIDVLRSGFIMVQLAINNGGTIYKGAQVYVCINTTGAHVAGTIEAGSVGGTNVALTGCFFNGTPDANGFVEISANV